MIVMMMMIMVMMPNVMILMWNDRQVWLIRQRWHVRHVTHTGAAACGGSVVIMMTIDDDDVVQWLWWWWWWQVHGVIIGLICACSWWWWSWYMWEMSQTAALPSHWCQRDQWKRHNRARQQQKPRQETYYKLKSVERLHLWFFLGIFRLTSLKSNSETRS